MSVRWSIQLQLLLPMLAVVLLAILLASGATAYWAALRSRTEQQDNLHRVAGSLADAKYPLTQSVLAQVSSLSGAEFVLLDDVGRVRESSHRIPADEAGRLWQVSHRMPLGDNRPVVVVRGEEYLFDFVRLVGRDAPPVSGTLCLLFRHDRFLAQVWQATYPAIWSGLVAAAIAAATTVGLARRFVRPIHELVGRTAAIAAGDFAPAAVTQRNDELRDLQESINQMAERLGRYEHEIRRAERLQTLGKIGAGLAHQLRNAATGGRMAVELHQRECPMGAGHETLRVALRQFCLMESFLQRFLTLGKPAGGQRRKGHAGDLVADVLDLVRPTARHLGVALDFEPGQPLPLTGDLEAIRQLISNLVLNACEAAAETGVIGPRVVVAVLPGEDGLGLIRVSDNGRGPPAELQDRLFEPFATAKPEGMGLGLFVARQVAEAHGGTLSWRRRENQTDFEFRFPLDAE